MVLKCGITRYALLASFASPRAVARIRRVRGKYLKLNHKISAPSEQAHQREPLNSHLLRLPQFVKAGGSEGNHRFLIKLKSDCYIYPAI